MQLPDFREGETVVFSSPPTKDMKALMSLMNVKVVVRKLSPGLGSNEILVCGPGVEGLRTILPQLTPASPVERVICKSDGSQQLWICGEFALRCVSWAEDLVRELARGKQRLCVIDGGHQVAFRSGAEEVARLAESGQSVTPEVAANLKTHCPPEELLSELVRISPVTRYVLTCHTKGQGVPREDRVRYERFSEVVRIMGRTDSPASQKYLLGLIRRLYQPEPSGG